MLRSAPTAPRLTRTTRLSERGSVVHLASCVVGHPLFLGNRFFSSDPAVIRDNQNDMFVQLRSRLLEHGVELNTEDITPPSAAKLVIQVNVPRSRFKTCAGQVAYLLQVEPEVVSSRNWDRRRHAPYSRVLTWRDDLADGEKYFLIRNGYDLTVDCGSYSFEHRRFCAMVFSPKRSRHPLALYGERVALAQWMMKHRPGDFDLYGPWWPSSQRPLIPLSIERRLPRAVRRALDSIFRPNPIVRGPVASKRATLQRYRFSICFENMRDVPGWVTEKIFDSMCAGCIPVYWGASNIADLVPQDCFVDRRQFRDTAELVGYLDGITARDYALFQRRIQDFLSGPAAAPFRGSSFADTVTRWVVEDLALQR